MKKKELSIKDRVDILLHEGVDKPKKWSSIKEYKEPDSDISINIGDFWGAEWDELHKHHQEETKFLLDIIRELVQRIENET